MPNRLPSEEIPENIRNSNYVFQGIYRWFDDLWLQDIFPEIDKLYNFLDYRTIDDEYLDHLLYDKGFSTSAALTADMKRCILSKWIDIFRLRHTPAGFMLYFGCMLPDLEIDFTGERIYNFITDNSTKFGFGNADMLATVNDPNGRNNPPNLMTYIYHPSYSAEVELFLFYTADGDTTVDLLNYIKSIIPFEFPVLSGAINLNINFFRKTGEDVDVDGLTVTGTDFSSLVTSNYVGLDGKSYGIASINPGFTVITLDVQSWVTALNYDVDEKVIGSDSLLYVCLEQHVSTAVFATDVTSGYWQLVDGLKEWSEPEILV